MIEALVSHLWQSTVFGTAIAILVFVFRGSRARVRFWLWFTASLKFLIPFAPLVTLGSHLHSATPTPAATFSIVLTVAEMSQPLFDGPVSATSINPETLGSFTVAFAALMTWAAGFAALTFVRFRTWRRIRHAMTRGIPVISSRDVPSHVGVRAVVGLMEPAVVGIWRQTILVPLDIDKHLTRSQLSAVFAHELCHVRHRDNLTAAIHMVVEAVCWFHPAVWLIGAHLIDERERACDEEVLLSGGAPGVYADAILNVCKRYVAAPSWGVAGVSSANLRSRIESIMTGRIGRCLDTRRKIALVTAATVSLALPVASGTARAIVHTAPTGESQGGAGSQATNVSIGDLPSFEVASIKQNKSGEFSARFGYEPGGQLIVVNNAVRNLIRSAYHLQDYQILGGPGWMNSDRYDVSARAGGNLSEAQSRLMLQRLLRERFKLVARMETREIPIYTLVVARSGQSLGPNLRRAAVDCMAITAAAEKRGVTPELPPPQGNRPACGTRSTPGLMMGAGVSMSDLARNLAGPAGRMVVDKTGLTGSWDLDLTYVMDQPIPNNPRVLPPPADAVPLFTALQEQLGLKLEARRAPVEVLVIVSIERPTEN